MNNNTRIMTNESYLYIDTLFRRIKHRNNLLLENSNLDKLHIDATVEEAFEFYISCFGLSFLNNLYHNQNESLGQFMNMRCIIEGVAVLKYSLQKNDIITKELLRAQSYIIERNIYKKYPDFDSKLFDFSSISSNYEAAKKLFKEKNESLKEKNILNKRILFLSEDNSYAEIVKIELGEEFSFFYKTLSQKIHPHSYTGEHNDGFTQLLEIKILKLLENTFKRYPDYEQFGLKEEHDLAIKSSEILIATDIQFNITMHLSRRLNNKKFTYLSLLLFEYAKLLYDFAYDGLLGYSEHGTTKLKNLLELLGIMNYVYHTTNGNFFEFAYLHTYYMRKININGNNEEDRINLYNKYKKVYPLGVEYSKFTKKIDNTLGFLINQEGEIPTLKELAFSVINDYSSSIDEGIIRDHKHEISLNYYMKMKYDECQVMSHASGYMLFSTLGAWGDGINIMYIMDDYYIKIMEKIAFSNNNLQKIQSRLIKYINEYKQISVVKKYNIKLPRILKTY